MSVDGAFTNVSQQQQQQVPMQGGNRPNRMTNQLHYYQQTQHSAMSNRQALHSPSPPPSQLHQQPNRPQNSSLALSAEPYYPAGSIVELKRQTGEQIRNAEVLLHDPIGNCIIVKLPAQSGRREVCDIKYFNLAFAEVSPMSISEAASSIPELDVSKVEGRLNRNIELTARTQNRGAATAAATPAATTTPAAPSSRPTA